MKRNTENNGENGQNGFKFEFRDTSFSVFWFENCVWFAEKVEFIHLLKKVFITVQGNPLLESETFFHVFCFYCSPVSYINR